MIIKQKRIQDDATSPCTQHYALTLVSRRDTNNNNKSQSWAHIQYLYRNYIHPHTAPSNIAKCPSSSSFWPHGPLTLTTSLFIHIVIGPYSLCCSFGAFVVILSTTRLLPHFLHKSPGMCLLVHNYHKKTNCHINHSVLLLPLIP